MMKKILLATPTMHTEEKQYIQKAFENILTRRLSWLCICTAHQLRWTKYALFVRSMMFHSFLI